MGLLLITILVVTEVALGIHAGRTGRHPRRAKAVARGTVLGAFALLVSAGVLQWSPRYHLLTAWLVVLALVSAAGVWMDRREGGPGGSQGWRGVAATAGVVLVSIVVALPIVAFPGYEPLTPTGDLAVATASYTFTDSSRLETFSDDGRHRWLTVGFWYPEVADRSSEGSLPLVVFSPGALGVRSSNESLFDELASHGYVVASVDHTHHSLHTTDQSGRRVWIDRGYVRELRDEDATTDPVRSHQLYKRWMDLRVSDISFVIDHIAVLAGQPGSEGMFRLVDVRRIGIVGHSLGGSAALGVGRARDDIDAVIALESPYMTDIEGVQDGEFVWIDDPYPVPVLNIYSDSAWPHLSEWPQYARNHEERTVPGATTDNVYIAGVGHLGLTDLALSSPFLTRLVDGQAPTIDPRDALDELRQVSLDFLDSHLRSSASN